MKRTLKWFARTVLTRPAYSKWMSIRSRNHETDFLSVNGLLAISAAMMARYGTTVLHGPFTGMQYPAAALLEHHGTPKLLGSYEQELHPLFAGLQHRHYQKVIDIGCAEGYYAVGLARLTGIGVHAFDTDPRARAWCACMADQNGVAQRVTIESWCDSKKLCALTENHRCFVFSDCEGFELELFTPGAVRHLSDSDVVIEVHERPDADVYGVLCARFEETHDVHTIAATNRDAALYTELDFLGTNANKAVEEYRGNGRRWIHLVSKRSGS